MTRPARVAHIGDFRYAGAQQVALTVARELPQYTHTVIVNSRNGVTRDWSVAPYQTIQLPFPRGSILDAVLFVPRLAGALREVKPDVVLAHFFGKHTLVSVAARMVGVRATVAVAPNCCDVEEIAAKADAGRDSRVHDGAAGHRLLVVVWASADCEGVIRGVALLRERGLDVQLSFVGGTYGTSRQDDLEKLSRELGVSGAITFLGMRSDVPELMGASDVVIHATHSEGFGLVLAEAFASRTPVIATDIPANREMLNNSRCGVLVPPRDHVAIANAVQALLTNTLHRRTVVNAAFKRVNELYEMKRVAAGYASLIDAAIR